MFLEIELKRGDSERLCGHVIAYARIHESALRDAEREGSPFTEMVHRGLLAITGDFRRQRSLRDFLTDMAGTEGIENLKNRLGAEGNLPEGLDVDQLFGKFDNMERLEAIPVPSQIIGFESEEELLATEADIFFVGEYLSLNNAHLVLSSFPILYQGLYREKEQKKIRAEIDEMLREIESGL